MDEKLAYSLMALALGWLLAQGTEWVKLSSKHRRIKTNLLDEIRDIDQLMIVALVAHQRDLQFAAQHMLEPATASPIGAVVFEQSFGEAAQILGQSQRLSYATIHNLRTSYNRLIEDRRQLIMEAQRSMTRNEQSRTLEFVTSGDQSAEALYCTAMEIRWHIHFHLDNPETPHLDLFGDVHRSYLEFQRDLSEDVLRIRHEALTLNRETMIQPFDEHAFEAMAKSFRRSAS